MPQPGSETLSSLWEPGPGSSSELTTAGTLPLRPLDRLLTYFSNPVDIASLVVFRIGFSIVVAWWGMDYLRRGLVTALYVDPPLHFGYYVFSFVRPWPGAWPYVHFAVMAAMGGLIAVGMFYRISTTLFATAFTTVFLWDRTNYQNHYYLIVLLSWLLVILPLNRCFSFDAQQNPLIRSSTVPMWVLWLVRLHIGIPYFYGGLAKMNADWLAGAAMRDFLYMSSWPPSVASWITTADAALAFAWGGLAFDLFVVPLLLWRRTRVVAYFGAVAFHVMNHFLFSIHIFPWFMLIATTIFFEPGWPRWWLRTRSPRLPPLLVVRWTSLSIRNRCAVSVAGAYVLLQLILPLRHLAYGGDIGWHERGHYFAWRMMNRSKRTAMRLYVTDAESQETWYPNLRGMVTGEQLSRLSRDPEMVLDLAHQLARLYQQDTGKTLEVRVVLLTCYNGRKPQLQIDPRVNLVKEPRGFHHRPWIMPQREPIPAEPWNRPLPEWESHVEIPPLPQVSSVQFAHRWPSRSTGR